ncbi:MAG: protein-disulfide reductase DsbD family protein [Candidatus Melainabacteria bacterium]|nr:protein-disulfide reductase DsbD family protein [Candidatus Melainabacteria bacterium]
MNKILPVLVAGLLLLFGSLPGANAQSILPVKQADVLLDAGNSATQAVSVTLIADTTAIEAGKPFRIGADFSLQPGWHIYYQDPGDSGMPTSVDITVPEGFKVVKVEWEKPKRFDENGFVTYGYSGKTVISVTVMPPDNLSPGASIAFDAKISWLACKDSCIPGDTTSSITLPVASATVAALADNQTSFSGVGFTGDVKKLGGKSALDQDLKPNGASEVQHGFWMSMLLAFIGGMILNLMPCVLPVISLKIVRFVQEAGESRATIARLGFAYSVGTVSTCVALAVAVILAKSLGYTVGWGFQFQEPLFLVGMTTLLTVMSLGLFGVFFLQVQSGQGLDKLANRKGLAGAFFTGVVATILSTPCTAPFLGSAIGFAFAQPWWVIIAIFFSVGSGLAFPYLMLCLNPAWMKLLPKPGVWMEHFKQGMGFVLLGSVIWMLYVLGRQVGPDGVAATVAFLLAASFGTWLYNSLGGFDASRKRKPVLAAVALAIAGSTMYFLTYPAVKGGNWVSSSSNQTGGIVWEKFSKDAVDKALNEGKVVFIDFTAEWCQTCKFNEATVLAGTSIQDAVKNKGVVALKADWTNGGIEITEVLAKFGRAGVPLYVVMSPHRPTEPIVLPTILTTQMVLDALEQASRP